jgi:hypothetical protein
MKRSAREFLHDVSATVIEFLIAVVVAIIGIGLAMAAAAITIALAIFATAAKLLCEIGCVLWEYAGYVWWGVQYDAGELKALWRERWLHKPSRMRAY